MKFYYIYKSLAHPEINGYVTPYTLEERLMHVAQAKQKLGSRIRWLCDSIANDLKHALGDAPNSEFVISPEGKIVRARRWSNPQQLRADLVELVGDVAQPTSIADLALPALQPPKTAAKGVVPRIQLPGRMMPIKVRPLTDRGEEPFYVKLRAEIEPQYFQRGSGKLYLGFFLDPLYQVHWNNRAPALHYEIEAPRGLQVSPLAGKGPEVKPDADADPREFLLDISGPSRSPLQLTVKYFACDDAETFCKPMTQHYEISLQRDPDGGSRRAGGGSRLAAGRPGNLRPPEGARPGGLRPGGFGARGARTPQASRRARRPSPALKKAVAVFKKYDTNRNGRLEKQEWAQIGRPVQQADTNSDAEISLQELTRWLE